MKYMYHVEVNNVEVLVTSDWQKALDSWSISSSASNFKAISVKQGNKLAMYIKDRTDAKNWSKVLIENSGHNRVEKRIMKEMFDQEHDGMEVLEIKETGNFGYNSHLEKEAEEQYEALIAESNYIVPEKYENKKALDFHGNFSSLDKKVQDEIINPKHYKMIPKEAYINKPDGLEYMDLMEYILDDHEGVEAHLLGQVFKYACRLGKKDAKLQDAKKIAWYANRLVNVIEYPKEKE